MKKALVFCLVLLTLCACAAQPSAAAIQTAIANTQTASLSEAGPTATITPLAATRTPAPSATPPVQIHGFAWNGLQALEEGGLRVEIARLVVMDKNTLPPAEQERMAASSDYTDKNTIVQIYFKISNNGDQTVHLYVNQGLVLVNDEQVKLFDFIRDTDSNLGGEFLPGASVIGVSTFALKRVSVDEVNKMTIKISQPFDAHLNSLGQDYLFNLDLSQHAWATKPAEFN
jgi:hypothetical protein